MSGWWEELREVLWLASVVGGLSVLAVVVAVALAVIGEWQQMTALPGTV